VCVQPLASEASACAAESMVAGLGITYNKHPIAYPAGYMHRFVIGSVFEPVVLRDAFPHHPGLGVVITLASHPAVQAGVARLEDAMLAQGLPVARCTDVILVRPLNRGLELRAGEYTRMILQLPTHFSYRDDYSIGGKVRLEVAAVEPMVEPTGEPASCREPTPAETAIYARLGGLEKKFDALTAAIRQLAEVHDDVRAKRARDDE